MAANDVQQNAYNQIAADLNKSEKPDLVLWTHPNVAVCGWRTEVYLQLAGVPYTVKPVNLGAGEQKTEEFLKLNPRGKVPVLVDNVNNVVISESVAIINYIAGTWSKGFLIPRKVEEFARHHELIFRYQNVLYPTAFEVPSCLYGAPVPEGAPEKRLAEWKNWDEYLEGREWIVNDKISIVDIILLDQAWLTTLAGLDFEKAGYKNLAAWWKRINEVPEVKKLHVQDAHRAMTAAAHPNGFPDLYSKLYK